MDKRDVSGISEDHRIGEISLYIDKMLQSTILTLKEDDYNQKFIKQKIVGVLKEYTQIVLSQQTSFNSAITPAMGKTNELLNELLNSSRDLKTATSDLEKNKQIQQQLINQLAQTVRDQDKKIDQMMQLFNNSDKERVDTERQIAHENQLLQNEMENIKSVLGKLEDYNVLQHNQPTYYMKSYAQSGEDAILDYIIRVNRIPYDKVTYIDLGANHAKNLSNTYFLYSKGAKGVIVEANPALISDLTFYRNRDIILNNCVDIETGKQVDFYIMNVDGLSTISAESAEEMCRINPELKVIDKKTLITVNYNYIVENYLGATPTILSIDLEGKDMEVLQSINFEKYRPLLILVEMIEYDTKLAYSTKNNEVVTYMKSQGYDEYAFTGINSIFIDKSRSES